MMIKHNQDLIGFLLKNQQIIQMIHSENDDEDESSEDDFKTLK